MRCGRFPTECCRALPAICPGCHAATRAIASDAPKYTATRMLSIMVKRIKKEFPDIVRLISYQDTEVHKGTIYKAA